MSDASTQPWPVEIILGDEGARLDISFDDDTVVSLTSEFLRVESPSAEVKGHGPGQEVTVPGKRGVRITRVEPVGNYAVRLIFDDGHDTGLYSWELLHRMGRDKDAIWRAYLDRLEAEGRSRDAE